MPADSAPAPQLSRRSFLLALALTLAIFFGLNPLWRPLDMDAMDANIAWSYAPIPLLVAGLLALERKLRWSSWGLEVVRLTCVKFAITFLFANILWTFTGPPHRAAPPAEPPPPAEQPDRFAPRPAPAPTPLDPAATGRLSGRVVDAAGHPAPGALVAVTGGLGELVFAPREEGVELAHDGVSLQPRAAVVQVFETLRVRGEAERLHSVRARDGQGRHLFNLPIGPGAERTLMFDRPLGLVTLACSVHEELEPVVRLVVAAGPCAAVADADGRFALPGVPAGELELTAWGPPGRSVRRAVTLAPGGEAADVDLVLP